MSRYGARVVPGRLQVASAEVAQNRVLRARWRERWTTMESPEEPEQHEAAAETEAKTEAEGSAGGDARADNDTGTAAPEGNDKRRVVVRRLVRWTAIALIGIAGGWLGMLLAGGASVQVGPVQTLMSLRPSLSGQTLVNVPPLGSLQMNTHSGPLRLNVDV